MKKPLQRKPLKKRHNKQSKFVFKSTKTHFIVGALIIVVALILSTVLRDLYQARSRNQTRNISASPTPSLSPSPVPEPVGKWNRGVFTVVKKGQTVSSFNLKDKPESAVMYEGGRKFAMVANNTLYVHSDGETKEVYKETETYTVYGTPETSEVLHYSISDPEFSPNGNLLIFYINGWEISYPQIYNIQSNKLLSISDNTEVLYDSFWNSDNRCLLNIIGYGMYGPSIQLDTIDDKVDTHEYSLTNDQIKQLYVDDEGNDTYEVMWGDNCSGVVKNTASNVRYGFSLDSDKLIELRSINASANKPSLQVNQEEIFIAP